jgi:hypothetical protein
VIDIPVGRPDADHVLAPVPPVAVAVTGVYARFTVQSLRTNGNVTCKPGLMVMLRVRGAFAPVASVTVTVTELNVPTEVGVPLMTPFALMVSPVGKPVAAQV